MNVKLDLQFLGHATVLVTAVDAGRKLRVLIDPFIDANPQCKYKCADFSDVNHIVLTHGHDDHTADVVEIAKLSGACISATYELCSLINKNYEGEFNYMNKGGEVHLDGVSIKLTHAIHSSSYQGNYAGEACGVLLRFGDKTVYHAGDTALIPNPVGGVQIDLACVPIGDRFTMGIKDAARFVADVNPKKVVPVHYNTFPLIAQNPEEFVNECREVCSSEVIILQSGESFTLD